MTALETKDKANYYIVGYKWLDMEGLCAIGKVCAVSKQDIEQVRSRGKDFF